VRNRIRLFVPLLAAGSLLFAVPDVQGRTTQTIPRVPCSETAVPKLNGHAVSLYGTWSGNDGGTYWIRQIGNCIWWTGFSGPVDTPTMGKSFSNVLFGSITASSTTIATVTGYWADVPRGGTRGTGLLVLIVRPDSLGHVTFFVKSSKSTGSPFGGTAWKRIS